MTDVYVLTVWSVDPDGKEYWKFCKGVFATEEAAKDVVKSMTFLDDEEWEIIGYEVKK